MKLAIVLASVLIGSGIGALVGSQQLESKAVQGAPAPQSAQTATPQNLAAELEAARARIAALEDQVHRLRVALDAAEESRIAREREFLRFTQGISQLGALAGGVAPTFPVAVPESAATEAAVPAPTDATAATTSPGQAETAAAASMLQQQRSRAIFLDLRALLAAEQVQGIDLLESGNLQNGFVGPVVMRVLDEHGRPLGSLTAERLRLEASRAARMVTIVLEQGCERRDGTAVPFAGGPVDEQGRGGQRRIVLSDCDPKPWIAGMPEIFPASDKDEQVDEGRYDLPRLRATLNTLLRSESGAGLDSSARGSGSYRMQGIGGVQGSVLRDVALDQLDKDGRVERRFFADRLSFLRETHGLQIVMEGGSQLRGDQKTPFLDGRYRIFLPRADVSAWSQAGVPGLVRGTPAPAVAPVTPTVLPAAVPTPSVPAEPR